MQVLVTGGAGFVGSHLVDALLEQGDEVMVIDNLSNGSLENLDKRAKIWKQDISEPMTSSLSNRYPHFKPECIFHLACHPRSMSFSNPYLDTKVNINGTITILEIAKQTKAKVIFSSNSGIYGTPTDLPLPINEAFPNRPSTPYDVNKLASEYHMEVYSKAFGFPITIFRFATVFGSRQRVSPTWKPVIAEFVVKLLSRMRPTIDGDGKQTRDFIHVSDVVSALVSAMDLETGSEPIILSSNTETSIQELYGTVASLLNFNKEPLRAPAKLGDVRRMWYNNSKAKKILSWKPKMTLRKALEEDVIPYYQSKIDKNSIGQTSD
jgi:UDP-glucose 4-epimerase